MGLPGYARTPSRSPFGWAPQKAGRGLSCDANAGLHRSRKFCFCAGGSRNEPRNDSIRLRLPRCTAFSLQDDLTAGPSGRAALMSGPGLRKR
jgi:hypothetical protein